jgi:hypothetical protein
MKTEAEVKERLKADQKELKATKKRFEKYDDCDDMHMIDEYEARISTLKWVLGFNE